MLSKKALLVTALMIGSLVLIANLCLVLNTESKKLSQVSSCTLSKDVQCTRSNSPVTNSSVNQEKFLRKESDFLLIMVMTAPDYADRRNAIRNTWIQSYEQKDKRFLVKFVIGMANLNKHALKNLLKESSENKDIVFIKDHLDSYHNLTRKVLNTLLWADRNVNFKYLMKIDDDCFPRLDTIERELRERSSCCPLYWGAMVFNTGPITKGKWREDYWGLGDHYMAYARGGGYILSKELVHNVVKNQHSLQLYENEDVSVGLWVSPFVQERRDDEGFDPYRRCTENTKLNSHLENTVHNIYEIHKTLSKTGSICLQ